MKTARKPAEHGAAKSSASRSAMTRGMRIASSIVAGIAAVSIIAVAVLYGVSGGFMRQTYLEPWSKSYAARYSDPRVRLAAVGLLAASNHNMQPWKIKLDSNPMVFSLYADSSRMTRQVDPQARQMMVSQGTFLEYVAVAATHDGYHADISLFPDGEYDESHLVESMNAKPVATVTLKPTGTAGQPTNTAQQPSSPAQPSTDAAEPSTNSSNPTDTSPSTDTSGANITDRRSSQALYDAMFLPDTNREAYRTTKLTKAQVTALTAISVASNISHGSTGSTGSTVETGSDATSVHVYQDHSNVNAIAGFAMRSATIEAGVSRVMNESNAIFRANEYQKNHYRYGYSVEGQGTSGFKGQMMQGLVTILPSLNTGRAASKNFIVATKTSVDHTAAYATLVTADNTRLEQVISGMVYSRFVLTAHTLGLVMQPLSQMLEEYPEMHGPYSEFAKRYAPTGGTVQMLVRVGSATGSVPLSMRRDVSSLLIDSAL